MTIAQEAPLSRQKFLAVMAVLTLTEALSSLEHTMVFAAMPAIAREEGLTESGWIVTIFLLVQAATAAIGARLGDMFGRRRVLIVLIGLCMLGSLLSAIAGNFAIVILGRSLQGASGAILALCYGIAKKYSPAESAPFWVGVLTGGYAVASAAGYLLGGYLSDIGSWRDIFWLGAGYAVFLLPLVWLVIPADPARGPAGRIDIVGGLLFAPAIALLLYGLTRGSSNGWLNINTLLFIAAGVVLTAFWARHEYRHEQPLLDVRLFTKPKVRLGNICGALAALSVMQLPLIFMTLMQQPPETGAGLGQTATMAGVLKLPSNILAFFAATLGGYICAKRGGATGILAGGVLAVLSWTALIFVRDSLWPTFACMLVCAFSSSILLSAVPNILLEDAPEDRASEVVGFSSTIRGMASAIGAQLIILGLASSQVPGPGGSGVPSPDAYLITILYVILCSIAITLLSLRAVRRERAELPGHRITA